MLHSFFRALDFLDNIAANVNLGGEDNVTFTRPKLALQVQQVQVSNFTGLSFSVELNRNGDLDDDSLSGDSSTPSGSLSLPNSLFQGRSIASARVSFGVFTDSDLYVRDNTTNQVQTVSVVISADVYSNGSRVTVTGLSDSVQLSFQRNTNVAGTPRCVYWSVTSKY